MGKPLAWGSPGIECTRKWGTISALIVHLMEGPEPAAEVHVNVSLSGAVETRKNVCPGAALKQVGMPQMCACEQKIAKWGLALCGKGAHACTHEHGSMNAHCWVLGPSTPSMRNRLDRIIGNHITHSHNQTTFGIILFG